MHNSEQFIHTLCFARLDSESVFYNKLKELSSSSVLTLDGLAQSAEFTLFSIQLFLFLLEKVLFFYKPFFVVVYLIERLNYMI